MSGGPSADPLTGPYVVCRVYVLGREDFFFVFPTDDEQEARRLTREALAGDYGEDEDPKLRVQREPHHGTVGHRWRGLEGIYRCTSYDSRQGFWMENEATPGDRRNVSERAPGRTFHRIHDDLPED